MEHWKIDIMPKVKSIITGGFEVIKDSAKQLAGAVSPGKLVEQAIGPKTQSSEFSDYLKKLGPDVSPEELEKKKKELGQADQKRLEEERKKLQAVTTMPAHMRLPEKQKEPRPYEAALQEEERKKAQAVEMQKKQPQPVSAPAGKQPRGMLGARKRPKASDFEAGKNIKIG